MPSSSPPQQSQPLNQTDINNLSPSRLKSIDTTELLHNNRTVIAASCAAVVGVIAGFPFDSVKTRMQAFNYPSLNDCIKSTYRAEGLQGFFRGMLPPLISVSFVKSASFSVYVGTKEWVGERYPDMVETQGLWGVIKMAYIGGFLSGSFTSFFTAPMEIVKVLRQLQELIDKEKASRTLDSSKAAPPISKLWLYYGFGSQFLKDSIGTGVYFASYEVLKRVLSRISGNEAGPMIHLVSGGLCGMIAWTVIFPIDMLKSIIQKETLSSNPKYRNIYECARAMYREHQSIKPFYRGMSATMVRAAPIHSLNWFVYEGVMKFCTRPVS
ncbi:mitochondrial carrier domain-containing protein [Paraphysoderma sedebokerense]|nr:mitochondrial carrier domain-containing protein [Paraphysoderma sedebokerense]KAI9141266.1 mitochondrial carrier domain-containing protein [Paraphysoderma sedebokerense]